MKKTFFLVAIAAKILVVVISLNACRGGEVKALQAQVDSLSATVVEQAEDLGFYQGCLTMMSSGLDSIAKADSNLVAVASNKENTITRESIKENLDAYAALLTRQRQQISKLQNDLENSTKERVQMQALIDLLNRKIEEKDATIQRLQESLEISDFNVEMLQDEVTRLYAANEELTNTVNAQRQTIAVAQRMLNEAYYIVGSSKELKEAGVLSSRFLAKSKVNPDEIDASLFKTIDIRRFKKLTIPSSKPTIKSQHPSDSYKIISDKGSNTSTLQILDEISFWSITRFLIIQN